MDLMSLIIGVLFVGLGIAFGLEQIAENVDLDPGWVGAILLLGLGIAGIASVVSRPGDRRTRSDEDANANGA